MPSIQIKNVPDDVHRVMRHRAVDAGQSLQEYLLAKLTEDARKPTLEELFREIESEPGDGCAPTEEVVRIIRADRESH
ncbi:MAG: hypothetical protein M3355_07305 [Actinomycetota bacterium]|nr:hypothetical protein [Actinomycetota bacterium]